MVEITIAVDEALAERLKAHCGLLREALADVVSDFIELGLDDLQGLVPDCEVIALLDDDAASAATEDETRSVAP